MQIKATLILSTLAVFAAAHDGHEGDHSTYPGTWPGTYPAGWGKYSTDCESSTLATSYTSKGYNTTYSTKTAPYTTGYETTKPAATTPTSTPPAVTAGASKSEFAMAVLGLGVAAGLIL